MWKPPLFTRMMPIVLFSALVTCGCDYVGPLQVNTYWSLGVQKSRIGRTYDWSPKLADSIGTASPDVARVLNQIKSLLTEQFATRGYQPAAGDEPSVLVNFFVGSREMGQGTGYVDRGTLIVDLLDPASGDQLWRGTAEANISTSDSPELRDQRLREALRRMLADLPDYAKRP